MVAPSMTCGRIGRCDEFFGLDASSAMLAMELVERVMEYLDWKSCMSVRHSSSKCLLLRFPATVLIQLTTKLSNASKSKCLASIEAHSWVDLEFDKVLMLCEFASEKLLISLLSKGVMRKSAANCLLSLLSRFDKAEALQFECATTNPLSEHTAAALRCASKFNSINCIAFLISRYPFSQTDMDKALLEAVVGNSFSSSLKLLKNGALTNQVHVDLACQEGNLDLLEALLTKYTRHTSIFQQYSLESALALAARFGHKLIVEYLVQEHKIDVCSCGDSALKNACEFGWVEIVRYLQSKGARVDSLSLELAVESGSIPLLMDLYPRLIGLSFDERAALRCIASRNGDTEIERLLQLPSEILLRSALRKMLVNDR